MSYIINRIKNLNKGRFDYFASQIARQNNKSKNYVKFKMILSFLRYGTSYTDYMKGNYINLSSKEKKDFINDRNYRKLISYLNDENYQDIFLDKIKFNDKFKKYLGRNYLDLRNCSVLEFEKFLDGKKSVFAKKHNSCGGDGVKKIVINKELDINKLYKTLLENKQYLIEETIVQHDYLNKISPTVVNNIRLVTLLKDGEVHLIANTVRLNTGSEEVISCEDIFATLDENGNLLGNVVDADFNIYKEHPLTKFKFEKVKIPYIAEAIKMVKKAALIVPEIRYIGWDVAITPEGPVIIEGNFYPSYGLFQYYLFEDGQPVGKLKIIKEVLGDEIKKAL